MMRSILLVVILLLAKPSFCLEISILTCSPGTDLYSVFGHSAIRVQSPETGHDWVYNYGTFNFNTDGFYVKFARGQLDYMLSRQPFPNFQYEYLVENRSIHEQKLLLSEENLLRLKILLEENYRPENRFYKYDFFFDNCATRIWDIVNTAVDGKMTVANQPDTLKTFRETVEWNLRYMPWAKIGISLALGAPYDRQMKPGEETFLPLYLMQRFDAAQLDGKPVTAPAVELLNREEIEERTSVLPVLISTLLLFGFGWMYVRKKTTMMRMAGAVLLWLVSILGVAVLLLWFATDHVATKLNPDLFWTFPFAFLLIWRTSWTRKVRWVAFFSTLIGLGYYLLFVPAVLSVKLFFIPLITCLLVYHLFMLTHFGEPKGQKA